MSHDASADKTINGLLEDIQKQDESIVELGRDRDYWKERAEALAEILENVAYDYRKVK